MREQVLIDSFKRSSIRPPYWTIEKFNEFKDKIDQGLSQLELMFEDYFEQIEDQLEEAMENQTDPDEDDQLITKLQ